MTRRLQTDFVTRWDAWLQSVLTQTRHTFGAQWLEVYLTSPVWRFALQEGVCGDSAYLGVLIPSVDSVGRYFPLTAAVPCRLPVALPMLAKRMAPWFATVEQLLLETLADSPLDLEDLDRRLAALASDDAEPRAFAIPSSHAREAGEDVLLHFAPADDVSMDAAFGTACCAATAGSTRGIGYWWTDGSERVSPCVVASSGLPAPQPSAALLDGRWEDHGWRSVPVALAMPLSPKPLACASAGFSDRGAREMNEDSIARDDEHCLWIVADGLGGHRSGGLASRMVTSVARLQVDAADVDRRIAQVSAGLQVVNSCLHELTASGSDLVGSTVAALAVADGRAAWLWAGDSRIYRWRGDNLELLTSDHSDDDGDSRKVTRAVGAPGRLVIDSDSAEALPGDRYMLCTDGIWAHLPAEHIALALSLPTPEEACTRLREAVADGDASDNFSAIVIAVAAVATVSTVARPDG